MSRSQTAQLMQSVIWATLMIVTAIALRGTGYNAEVAGLIFTAALFSMFAVPYAVRRVGKT